MILLWTTASLLAIIGCIYLIVAAILVGRFARSRSMEQPLATPAITVLKPLHGNELGLDENLMTFCRQDYSGPTQIICGLADPDDAAIAVVERLRSAMPNCDLNLVVNSLVRGANRKVSNLINMEPSIRHSVVVLADSDIRVRPEYLSHVVAALEQPGVGAVTCMYYGDAIGGAWSKLLALDINSHFLPNAIVGIVTGLARPCFGSTIAFKRETLAMIGGFKTFADHLADDYAIGSAVRAHGGDVAIPPLAVPHMCSLDSAKELWRHELRWARTIKSIDPLGYAGSLITHPFVWALCAALIGESQAAILAALAMAAVSLACRVVLLRQVQQVFSLPQQSYWLLPARELISFIVFMVGIVGRRVIWKARLYQAMSGGLALAGRETR